MPMPKDGMSRESWDEEVQLDSAQNISDPEVAEQRRKEILRKRQERRAAIEKMDIKDLEKILRILLDGLGESQRVAGESHGFLRETRAIARSISVRVRESADRVEGMENRLESLESHCSEAWGMVPKGFLPFWIWNKTVDKFDAKPLAAFAATIVLLLVLAALVVLGVDLGLLGGLGLPGHGG